MARFRIIADGSEFVALQLPPAGRFHDAVRHDGAEGLRKSIVARCGRIPRAAAATIQILEKQLALDRHVQHPESVPGASPEERLQGEEPIPTEALGVHGRGFAIQRTGSVRVRNRKKLRVQMWV